MFLKFGVILILLFNFLLIAVCKNGDECICPQNNINILCENETIINGEQAYCDNFNCVYNLIPDSSIDCATTHYKFTIAAGLRPSIDYLVFKNNGKFIRNFTAGSDILTNFFFTATNNYTFEFQSGSPSNPPQPTDNWFWAVLVEPIPAPFFKSVILNDISSRYVQWLPDMTKNDGLIVCSNDSTKTLKMFSSYSQFGALQNFALYDGRNLNNFVQNLRDGGSILTLPNVRSTISSSQCFTLYASEIFRPDNNGNTVLFTAVDNDSNQNCQNENTVFQTIIGIPDEFNVSIKSTDKGSCEMIILAVTEVGTDLPHVWLRGLSTSSSNGQYIFKSTVNDKTLLSLNNTEISQWKYLGFYSPALSIVASISSDISVQISGTDQNQKWINVDSEDLQKGIITSPSYCGFMRNFDNYQLYRSLNFYNQIQMKFNVKEIYGSPNIIFNTDGQNQSLNSNLTTTTISSNFSINYAEKDALTNGFLIEYTIINVGQNGVKTTTENNNAFEIQISFVSLILSALISLYF